MTNVHRANHCFMHNGRELWVRVPMGDTGVRVDAPLGGVRLFSHDYKGTRLLFLDVAEASDDDESGFEIASVALDEARVDELIEKLTAWRSAPRLAAREHAEVVLSEQMVDVTIALLKTSAGEWGVCTTYSDEEAAPDLDWFPNETAARAQFYTLIGCVTCDGCDELVDRDDATDHGDGYYCEDCAEKERERFKRTTYRCVDGGVCEWTGLGPALAWNGDEHECPTCGGEVEEVGVAPTEAPAP